ncbi:MAG: hypothetical protein M3527_05110 [Actinomycetota bacterium]|nr:hypothetical protein [Actinomycetota bacterium]
MHRRGRRPRRKRLRRPPRGPHLLGRGRRLRRPGPRPHGRPAPGHGPRHPGQDPRGRRRPRHDRAGPRQLRPPHRPLPRRAPPPRLTSVRRVDERAPTRCPCANPSRMRVHARVTDERTIVRVRRPCGNPLSVRKSGRGQPSTGSRRVMVPVAVRRRAQAPMNASSVR